MDYIHSISWNERGVLFPLLTWFGTPPYFSRRYAGDGYGHPHLVGFAVGHDQLLLSASREHGATTNEWIEHILIK